MGTYLIPRDVKGEGRILTIFSYKALGYTVAGIIIGVLFYYVFKLIKLSKVGIAIMIILALLGFVLGTLRIPEIKKFEITKKTSGEKLDEILVRLIKFKMKKNRIYVYKNKEDFNG